LEEAKKKIVAIVERLEKHGRGLRSIREVVLYVIQRGEEGGPIKVGISHQVNGRLR